MRKHILRVLALSLVLLLSGSTLAVETRPAPEASISLEQVAKTQLATILDDLEKNDDWAAAQKSTVELFALSGYEELGTRMNSQIVQRSAA